MAKKLVKKTKTSKDQLRSSIRDRFTAGEGLQTFFPKNIEEQIAKDPGKLVKELSHTIAQIPISEIRRNPEQPRVDFDETALKELSDSIKVHGLIQPVTVRSLGPHEYQLISGERRLRASKLAGLEVVPAYIRIANDQEMLEMALIENIQRQDLNPMEIAITYQRLKNEIKLTDKLLSERVGKQRSTITNYLRLLNLHVEVQKALRENAISRGHALAIAGVDDILEQVEILKEVLKKKLSVRAAEKLVRKIKPAAKDKQGSKNKGLPADYKLVLDDFRAFFGSGKIQLILEANKDGKGRIVIPFSDVNELNELFKHIEQ